MLGAALLVSAILTPLLVPSTAAASKYKVLYKFTGGVDGELPEAGLIFDLCRRDSRRDGESLRHDPRGQSYDLRFGV
jgi:hypothetical protein